MVDQVYENVGEETLGVAGNLLNPTLSATDDLFEVITFQETGAGNFRAEWRFNSLSTTIYNYRFEQNGGASTIPGGAQASSILGNSSANDEENFVWYFMANIPSEEKQYISKCMDMGGPNAATAPQMIKVFGKGANVVALTSIQTQNIFGGGNFGVGSQMQVATLQDP